MMHTFTSVNMAILVSGNRFPRLSYTFLANSCMSKVSHTNTFDIAMIIVQDDMEELRRHITWMSNKAYIDQHNQYADTFGYTLEMNHLGDMVRLLHR